MEDLLDVYRQQLNSISAIDLQLRTLREQNEEMLIKLSNLTFSNSMPIQSSSKTLLSGPDLIEPTESNISQLNHMPDHSELLMPMPADGSPPGEVNGRSSRSGSSTGSGSASAHGSISNSTSSTSSTKTIISAPARVRDWRSGFTTSAPDQTDHGPAAPPIQPDDGRPSTAPVEQLTPHTSHIVDRTRAAMTTLQASLLQLKAPAPAPNPNATDATPSSTSSSSSTSAKSSPVLEQKAAPLRPATAPTNDPSVISSFELQQLIGQLHYGSHASTARNPEAPAHEYQVDSDPMHNAPRGTSTGTNAKFSPGAGAGERPAGGAEADVVTSSDSSSSAGSLINTVKSKQVAAGGALTSAPTTASRSDSGVARIAWLEAPSAPSPFPTAPASQPRTGPVAAAGVAHARQPSPSKVQQQQSAAANHLQMQANQRQVAPQAVTAAAPVNGRDSRLSAPVGAPAGISREHVHVPRAVRAFLKSSENRAKLANLPALVKGYLTRRLLRSEKVNGLIRTIQDTAQLMVSLVDVDATRVTREDTIKDSMLQERLYAQLRAALYDFHHLFFEASIKTRMAVIAHSRASRLEKRFRTRSAPNEQVERESQPIDEAGETESPEVSERSQVPRPPRLSSATLRSLQRKQQRAQQQLLQPAALPPPPASAHIRQAQARSLSSLQAGRLLDAAPAAPRAIAEASGGPVLGSFGRLAGVPLDARTGTYLIGRAQDRVLRPLQQADSHANSRAPNTALQGNGFPVGNGAAPAAALVSKNKSLPSSSSAPQQQQQTTRALPMNNAVTSAVPTSIKAVSNASRALHLTAAPQSARSAEPIAAVAHVKESARVAAVQQRVPAAKVNGTASRVLLAAGGPALRAPAHLNGANGDWDPTDHLDDDGLRENNGHLRV